MPKSKLKIALHFAKQGWYLFPCKWSARKKLHIPYIKWGEKSSTNSAVITIWDEQYPNCYFCVNLKASNLTVIDIDVKNEKQGFDTLEELELFHGKLPDTLQVTTPSGGLHYIYKGRAKFGANRLGPGIDIPVMVPLPGSEVKGKGSYELKKDLPVADLPQWVVEIAGKSTPEKENIQEPTFDLDQPQNIERAIEYLKKAEPAIEGEGGNDRTYRTACMVRDYGISKTLCLDLVSTHYNPNCAPPWSLDELAKLVDSAYQYASTPLTGILTPEADFEAVIPHDLIQFASFKTLTGHIALPAWLIKGYFEKNTIILLYGDSGVYKSFLAIDVGLHIALGKEWIGLKTSQGPVFYVAGEGHSGISRRLRAWKDYHNIRAGTIPFYISPHAIQISDKKATEHLIESIKAYGKSPELVIVDTLAANFGPGNESSTEDMGRFLNKVNLGLRQHLDCGVMLIHHTGHMAKERPRGAYALMAGVDSFFNVERLERDLMVLRSAGKMKDGIPPKDAFFKMNSIKIGVDEDLESVTSLVLEYLPDYEEPVEEKGLGINQALVLEILREAEEPLGLETLKREFRERKEDLGEAYEYKNLSKVLKNLEIKSLIWQESGKFLVKKAM